MSESTHTLPAPPRPITPVARARSWNEAPVRVWVILSVIVTGVLIYLATTRVQEGLRDRKLVRTGLEVRAQIVTIDDQNIDLKRGLTFNRDVGRRIKVNFVAPDGSNRTLEEELPPQSGSRVSVGQFIQIRIDPENPNIATTRSEPRPWMLELSVVFMLLPVLGLTVLVVLMRRAGVLKVWRDGVEQVAVVVDGKQSAIAPRSRVLRYTLRDSDDTRVFTLLYPTSAGMPQKDDELLVVAPPSQPDRALAAALYLS